MRGLSSLFLISEAMRRVQTEALGDTPEPCDHFDVIAGTGTGASVRLLWDGTTYCFSCSLPTYSVIACMLGRMRIPVKRAISFYERLVKSVFSDKKQFGSGGPEAFKQSKLIEALMEIIQEVTGNKDEKLGNELSSKPSCQTYALFCSGAPVWLT